MKMQILLPVIIIVLVFIIATEISGFLVFGRFLNDKEVEIFLSKNIAKYEINEINYRRGGKMLYGGYKMPYMATHPSFISKWYIEDYGQIPRLSKWSPFLDKVWENLPKPSPRIPLSEL